MLEDLLALSRILVGVNTLDPALRRLYLARLNSTSIAPAVNYFVLHLSER
jgi:hypothetical protein